MTVVPMKRKGGEPPRETPHIDAESYRLLVETLIGFLELCAEPDHPITPEHRAQLETMRDLTVRLETLAKRFNPPKGAA